MSGTNARSPAEAHGVAERIPAHDDATSRSLDEARASARLARVLWFGGAAFAIAWFVFALRLAFTDVEHQLLAADELHAVRVALDLTYDDIWSYYDTSDNSIPYTFYLEWLLERGSFTELAARVPAMAATALLLLTPFLFVRWIGAKGALVALALFATAPTIVFYAIVARPYAPAALLMTLATACWASWVSRPRFLPLAGFVVASVAAVFLHLYCLFSVLALLAVAALASRQGPVRFRAAFFGGLVIGAGIAALYFPGFDGLMEHRVGKVGGGESVYETLVTSYRSLTGELSAIAIVVPVLAVAGWFALSKRAPIVGAGLASVVLFQVLAMCATHPVGELNVFARYFHPVLPSLLLLAATGAVDLVRRGVEIVAPRASAASRVLASSAMALAIGSALAGLLPAKSPILLFRPERTSLRSNKESLLDASMYYAMKTPVFRHIADDPERGALVVVYPGFEHSDVWGEMWMRGLHDVWVTRGCDGVLVRFLRKAGLRYEHMVDVDDLREVRASGAKYLIANLKFARQAVLRRMYAEFGPPVARDEFDVLFDVREKRTPR